MLFIGSYRSIFNNRYISLRVTFHRKQRLDVFPKRFVVSLARASESGRERSRASENDLEQSTASESEILNKQTNKQEQNANKHVHMHAQARIRNHTCTHAHKRINTQIYIQTNIKKWYSKPTLLNIYGSFTTHPSAARHNTTRHDTTRRATLLTAQRWWDFDFILDFYSFQATYFFTGIFSHSIMEGSISNLHPTTCGFGKSNSLWIKFFKPLWNHIWRIQRELRCCIRNASEKLPKDCGKYRSDWLTSQGYEKQNIGRIIHTRWPSLLENWKNW